MHHQLSVPSHGTKVQVQDLFGNMPVRVKQRPAIDNARRLREKEWDWLRKNVTGLLLAWDSPVHLTVQGSDKGQILRFKSPVPSQTLLETSPKSNIQHRSFDLAFIRDTLCTGVGMGLGDWKNWVKCSARTPYLTLRAIISLEPAPSKGTQFICLGLRYLTQDSEFDILYDHVNALFTSSAFGAQEELSDTHGEVNDRNGRDQHSKRNVFTRKQLKGGGKGVDKWPMFCIRIDSGFGESLPWRSDLDSVERANSLTSIIKVLEAMIIGYLSENHLRPGKPRTRKPKAPLRDLLSPANQRSLPPPIRFQPPCDTENVSVVEKLVSGPRTSGSSTKDFGDLADNVRLPKFPRTESHESRIDFSGWSRIKGSLNEHPSFARPDPNPIALKLASPQQCDVGQQIDDDKETQCHCSRVTPEILSPSLEIPVLHYSTDTIPATTGSGSGCADTTLAELGNCLHDCRHTDSGDVILTWTNPVSKADIRINARTGSVVKDRYKSQLQRSCTAEEPSLPSYQSVNNQKLQPSATSSTVKSLPVPLEGSWADVFLKSWDNPIFRRTEEAIPRVSELLTDFYGGRELRPGNDRFCHGFSKAALGTSSTSLAARLTKQDLGNAEVITQVDKKFILIKVALGSPVEIVDEIPLDSNHVIVLVDQHAADERIRVEDLLSDLCVRASPEPTQMMSTFGLCSHIKTTRLPKSIRFPVKASEIVLFEKNATYFAKWGILFNLDRPITGYLTSKPSHEANIVILTLPAAIAERCRVDVKHLTELLRNEVWKREESGTQEALHTNIPCKHKPNLQSSQPLKGAEKRESWPQLLTDCPQGILDMLNSRSCRSAIMFNDELTLEECETLVKRLATCVFPFQCAHGRPSMVPLVNFMGTAHFAHGALPGANKNRIGRGAVDFREAWMRSMNHT